MAAMKPEDYVHQMSVNDAQDVLEILRGLTQRPRYVNGHVRWQLQRRKFIELYVTHLVWGVDPEIDTDGDEVGGLRLEIPFSAYGPVGETQLSAFSKEMRDGGYVKLLRAHHRDFLELFMDEAE